MPFEVNQHVGDYEILGLLGAGGMGHVYRTRNIISNRMEAMKVLLPDLTADRDLAVRFISEIRTLAGFDHPNIALLHTAFQFENQLIMMMEYVEGQTLEQRAKQSPILVADVVEYLSQTLSALGYAHQRNVVHRDIKPANLMITSHGIVKLMDFGIAKPAVDNHLTRPGTTVGSLYYMSPEQVRGSVVDARSDLYSTGIVLYELLAGRRPFESESTFGVLNQQLNTLPKPPIEINPALPQELDAIILKALAKAPEDRYQTAEEFRNELKRFAGKSATESQVAACAPVAAPVTTIPISAVPTPFPAAPTTQSPAWESVQPLHAKPTSAPQIQPIAAAFSPMPFSPMPSKKTSGNRSVWIASGALATVIGLVAVAFALPHLLKTHASEKPTTQTIATQPTVESPAVTPPPITADTPAQIPPALPDPAVANLANPYSNSISSGTSSSIAPASHTSGSPRLMSSTPSPARPGPQMTAANSPANLAPVPPPPAATSASEVEQLQERYIQLDARAQAVLHGVAQIRRQQEADGLGLRGDVEAADTKLRSYMQSANQDVHTVRAPQAAHDMDKAEAEIAILEKFLGR